MGKTILKILALFFILGWAFDFLFPPSNERWPGESPIAYIEKSESWLKVFGDTQSSASQLIKMNIFGKLHPSYSINKVLEVAGDPLEENFPDSNTKRLVYKSNEGKLFYEATKVDGGIIHSVSLIPFNARPESILSRKITIHLRPSLKKETVTIWNCDDNYYQFIAQLEEGLLREITWVDSEAYNQSFGREKRGACIAENQT